MVKTTLKSDRPFAGMLGSGKAETLARLERLAYILDSALVIPGTSIRFGADALGTLVPGIGLIATKGLSAWLILEAARSGAPRRLIGRMLANLGVDAAISAVPILGWAANIFVRANNRNVALLRDWLTATAGADAR